MNETQIKEKIRALLKSHQFGVIATIDVDNNKPESAVVAFAEKEDFSLIFGTSNKTRKYKNLQKNQNVSFVIGWSHQTGSIQYEGIAQELSDEEAMKQGEFVVLKNKQSNKFILKENQKYFLVTPVWIRFVDTSPDTAGNYEISLHVALNQKKYALYKVKQRRIFCCLKNLIKGTYSRTMEWPSSNCTQ